MEKTLKDWIKIDISTLNEAVLKDLINELYLSHDVKVTNNNILYIKKLRKNEINCRKNK